MPGRTYNIKDEDNLIFISNENHPAYSEQFNPHFRTALTKLEDLVQRYSLMSPTLKTGVFLGQLPRTLREISVEIDKLKKSPDRAEKGLANISKIAEQMGHHHPIYEAAKRCREMIADKPMNKAAQSELVLSF